jgi:hypothetical protein
LQRSIVVASGVHIAFSARLAIGQSIGLVAAAPPLAGAPPLAAPARPMPPRPAAPPPLAGAPPWSVIVSPPEAEMSPPTEFPPAVVLPEPAVLEPSPAVELSPAVVLLVPAVPSELSLLEPPHDALSAKPAMSTKPKPYFRAFIEILLEVRHETGPKLQGVFEKAVTSTPEGRQQFQCYCAGVELRASVRASSRANPCG